MRMIAIVALSAIVLLLSASAPQTTHAEPPPFVVGSVLYEDLNGSGVLDEGDAPPAQTVAILQPWDSDGVVTLFTAADGGFQFTNLPPGGYSLRVVWSSGFLDPASSPELPDILQSAFEVSSIGDVAPPSPRPLRWPNTEWPYEPDTEGALPPQILLTRNDTGVLPYGTGVDFNAIAVGEGSIDVGEAIRNAGVTATPEPPVVQDTAVVLPEQTATPTPALPEEGGPPGGVISGYVYVDEDGSRSRTAGDGFGSRAAISADTPRDGGLAFRAVSADDEGRWELRGLADGIYRVWIVSDAEPTDFSMTIPPTERLVLSEQTSFNAIVQTVEIENASRVTDVNFGFPARVPIAGAGGVTTPNAGTGSDSSAIAAWALAGAMALSVGGAALFAVARRRTR